MQTKHKNRTLLIYNYLMEQSDEAHQKSTQDIQKYLLGIEINAGQKTISADIEQLQKAGFDVVCNKSRQNLYFIGSRSLELPELKMLVDAVQAARFITSEKSKILIEKIAKLGSPYQAEELNRQLYVEGRVKTENTMVYITVDRLYSAMNTKTQVTFQYIEYAPTKEKKLKHDGQVYELSPFDLVWSNDSYYVFGYSKSHEKVVKFRVDRMVNLTVTNTPAVSKPENYDIASFCRQTFMMYDAESCMLKLLCDNSMMKAIIDRFGRQVETKITDSKHFTACVEASVSPTFYAWIFTYGGKLRILSPPTAVEGYRKHLQEAINNV